MKIATDMADDIRNLLDYQAQNIEIHVGGILQKGIFQNSRQATAGISVKHWKTFWQSFYEIYVEVMCVQRTNLEADFGKMRRFTYNRTHCTEKVSFHCAGIFQISNLTINSEAINIPPKLFSFIH